MNPKIDDRSINAYSPPEHFKETEKLPLVVPEAADDNTELWLIRIPSHEITPADLLGKRVRLKADVSDGFVGHFFNGQGQEYNIIKQKKAQMLQPYAIIPNGADPFVVRKINCQVGFVKAMQVEAKHPNEENSHHPKRDSTQHEQLSGLTSEEQQLSPLKNEKSSKKKRRRSELSEKN